MQTVLPSATLLGPWLDRAVLRDLPEVSRHPASRPKVSPRDRIAEGLLALLTSSAVRKGSLEDMQFGPCLPDLLRAIDRCVQAGKPVQLTLMAFPFKTPNPAKVGSRRLPDLAELAALVRLHQLNARAKSIYSPGLEIHLIHDGSYIAGVFGVNLEEVRSYESYFSRLVQAFDAPGFIHLHDFEVLQSACVRDAHDRETLLQTAALHWWRRSRHSGEWKDRFSKTLGMMNLRTLPLHEASNMLECGSSGGLPPEYGDLEHQVHVAMLRYYSRDALLHACDPRPLHFPDAIHATTQCRPGRLAIWLVNRGQSLLPWHGVGVTNRKGKWGVALAREVLADPTYHPVLLDGEDTPFFYQQRY